MDFTNDSVQPTVQNTASKHLVPVLGRDNDRGRHESPAAHGKDAHPTAKAFADHTSGENAEEEGNKGHSVEDGEPPGRKVVGLLLGIPLAELLLKGIHRLDRGEALVVEAIVEGRDAQEDAGQDQTLVEQPERVLEAEVDLVTGHGDEFPQREERSLGKGAATALFGSLLESTVPERMREEAVDFNQV